MKSVVNFISGVAAAITDSIDPLNKIWVNLNSISYVGGDTVAGTVELECIVPFIANGVILKYKGFERAHFQSQITEYVGEGQNRRAVQRVVDHKQAREFFRQHIIVYPTAGTIMPGHYSFPFQFQLPPNLPGTFYEREGNFGAGTGHAAMVLYKVKATVDVRFRHNLHSTVRLVINEKFDQLLKPSYGEASKGFLLTDGKLQARVWLDKNAYFPGQSVLAKLKVNNTSVKPTRKVNVKVIHVTDMHAHGQHRTDSHVEHTAHYPGFEPCFLGVRWLPFFIPVNVRPSTTLGTLVKSSYVLQVECDIPGAIDLQVNLPLRMLAPQFLWSAVPPQPPNAPIPPDTQVRPRWQPDEEAATCNECHTSFGLFTHRTHCRHCAKVFCKKCNGTEIPIPKLKYTDKVRVCNKCVPIVKQTGGVKVQSTKAVVAQWQSTVVMPTFAALTDSYAHQPQVPLAGGAPGSPPPAQPAPYPPQGQPGGYPPQGQPAPYGQPGGYPPQGQPAPYQGQPAPYPPQQGQPYPPQQGGYPPQGQPYPQQGQPAPYPPQQGQPAPYSPQPGQPAPYSPQQGQPAPYSPQQQGQPAPYGGQPAPGITPGEKSAAPDGASPAPSAPAHDGQPAPYGGAPYGGQPVPYGQQPQYAGQPSPYGQYPPQGYPQQAQAQPPQNQ